MVFLQRKKNGEKMINMKGFILLILSIISFESIAQDKPNYDERFVFGNTDAAYNYFDTLKNEDIFISLSIPYFYLELLKNDYKDIDTFDLQNPDYYFFTKKCLNNISLLDKLVGDFDNHYYINVFLNTTLTPEIRNQINCLLLEQKGSLLENNLGKVFTKVISDSTNQNHTTLIQILRISHSFCVLNLL